MAVQLVRVVCALYWVYLTLLLLAPHPAQLVPESSPLETTLVANAANHGVHFASMFLLALLSHSSRLGLSERKLLLLLLTYAVLTESLQWFVAPRCVELHDYLENVLGTLVGTLICWVAARLRESWTPAARARNANPRSRRRQLPLGT